MKMLRFGKWGLLFLLVLLLIGYLVPQKFVMPVSGANKKSYDHKSFWFYPWGKSVTHKGVDIFAREGTDVLSATGGLVVFRGKLERGGNAVIVLGPKWRFHYYAHLKEISIGRYRFLHAGSKIGTVGTTGNAAGKPAHLHYSISSLIPLPWRIDDSKQGWKKMFYLDPHGYLSMLN